MLKDLVDKAGCLEACQKQYEERVAILWIQLKINGGGRRNQKELFLTDQINFLRLHPSRVKDGPAV
jgi:hypothetical protein